jgi:hypothetical protein
MLSRGSNGSMPSPYRTLSSTQVRGISCISPRAPLGDMARPSPALSSCMTARIQCAGIANRWDASATRVAKDSARDALEERGPATVDSTPANAPDGSVIVRRTPQRHAATRRSHKPAIVLTAVQGKAPLRRPRGRPGPPLRATAGAKLVGTEEWCCPRSNRGMADFSGRTTTITPPWSTRAVPCR